MDYIVRATAANSQIRAFAITSREMVETARQHHNTSPVATAALGRLLTGGAMMGVMMKGDKDILTIMMKGDGPINGVTVTADSHGNVKGYVGNPNVLIPANYAGKLDVGAAIGYGTLTVIKDMGLKEPYSSQVPLGTSEAGSFSSRPWGSYVKRQYSKTGRRIYSTVNAFCRRRNNSGIRG